MMYMAGDGGIAVCPRVATGVKRLAEQSRVAEQSRPTTASRRVWPHSTSHHQHFTPPARSAAPGRGHTGMHPAPREGRRARTLRPLLLAEERSSAPPAADPHSSSHPTDTPIALVVSLRSMPVLQQCRISHFQAKWCRNGREKDERVIRCSDAHGSLDSHPPGVNRTREARIQPQNHCWSTSWPCSRSWPCPVLAFPAFLLLAADGCSDSAPS